MAQNDGAMSPPGAMSLTGDLASGWVRWIELFQFYMMATEKTTKPGTVHVALLLTLIGLDAIAIFRTFDKDGNDKVKTMFAAYFKPRGNVTYESTTL